MSKKAGGYTVSKSVSRDGSGVFSIISSKDGLTRVMSADSYARAAKAAGRALQLATSRGAVQASRSAPAIRRK